MKETDIQREICEYLELKGFYFWRSNNTPIYDKKAKRYRAMPKFAKKGVPDIIVVLSPLGRFVGLEVKQSGSYLSKDQKAFKGYIEGNGGIYALVRSVEDVIAIEEIK